MTTLLQINSSLFSSGGHSSQLANDFVAGHSWELPRLNLSMPKGLTCRVNLSFRHLIEHSER